MAEICFTPSAAGSAPGLARAFGTLVEWFVKKDYCFSKGGCSEFATLPITGGQNDFFDENAGTTRCRYLGAFLKFHHPAIIEQDVVDACEIRKRPVGDDDDEQESFPVPDIITHDPPARMEFYELKPNSPASRPKGVIKLEGFLAISDAHGLGYQRGTQYSPNRKIVVWDGTWFGSPTKVRLHWELDPSESGLLLYDLCVEASGALLVEVLAKALVKMVVALLILLLAPVAGGVVVLADNSPLGGSVGDGGVNESQDTRYVQALLNDWRGLNGFPVIAVDGIAQVETGGAIRDFQTNVTGVVDGRIDVGGPAINALEQHNLDNANDTIAAADLLNMGVDGLGLLLVRPDPDDEGGLSDLRTAVDTAVAEYLVALHAEI